MRNLVRHDVPQQRSEVYMKALVQFLSRLEKYIAVAPASVFAEIGDPKNGVGQTLGPSRNRQLQVHWKLCNTAGRGDLERGNSRRLAVYPMHLYPRFLEDRTRRQLRLSQSIQGNVGAIVNRDGHENRLRRPIFGPEWKPFET